MTAEARTQSLRRARAGLAIAAVVLPLALHLLFERQARRLEALGEHGQPVEARVIGWSQDGRYAEYAYRVGATEYRWSVERSQAPSPAGQPFPATYLPEEPSFSRPIADRSLASVEAANNRSFAWKVVLGLAGFLLLFAGVAHRDVRRLESDAPARPAADEHKRGVVRVIAVVSVAVALIGGFHMRDSLAKGESIVPSLLGIVLSLAIVGGVLLFVGREGPDAARERSARLVRVLAPIAGALALARFLLYLFQR